jgi:hypothetical protein
MASGLLLKQRSVCLTGTRDVRYAVSVRPAVSRRAVVTAGARSAKQQLGLFRAVHAAIDICF